MTQPREHNRRIVLAARPHGAPVSENFRLETVSVPEPAKGQVLLRTVYLSLDPYMRGAHERCPVLCPAGRPLARSWSAAPSAELSARAIPTLPKANGCWPIAAGRITRFPTALN